MAFRLYIVPVIGTGTHSDPRRPKYFTDTTQITSQWSAVDYGNEPWMVVGADLTAAEDTFVASQPDVTALPFDLSVDLTGQQVVDIANKLESINVPASWVNSNQTWLFTIRTVLGMFSFMQRYEGISGSRLFTGGITLSTQFDTLPVTVQNNLAATATSMNLSTASLAGNNNIRAILKAMADQLSAAQYNFNGTLI